MLNSAKTIYKGDVLASWFYLSIGMGMLCISALLQHFQISLGFLYLAYGLAAFSLYCIGKGGIMWWMYRKRYVFYDRKQEVTAGLREEEIRYTKFRIHKKKQGRRVHVYIIVLGSVIAFAGAFSSEKGLILGTCIPVVLLSGIEFSVGLLTEFRLWEYLRILEKNNTISSEP